MRNRALGEFIERFPESEPLTRENMRRDAAESCFHLGNIEEGEQRFKELSEDFSDSQWIHIGWGDMYSPAMAPDEVEDPAKARKHYEQALKVTDDRDRDEIKGRIAKLRDSQ
ncbi:MAG: tol-pal system YbgF family protein [bacterium]